LLEVQRVEVAVEYLAPTANPDVCFYLDGNLTDNRAAAQTRPVADLQAPASQHVHDSWPMPPDSIKAVAGMNAHAITQLQTATGVQHPKHAPAYLYAAQPFHGWMQPQKSSIINRPPAERGMPF
jgi:hypothetical protein